MAHVQPGGDGVRVDRRAELHRRPGALARARSRRARRRDADSLSLQAVYTLLLAIWPSIANLDNGIPSSGTDTAHFLSFFLFTLLLTVAVWFPFHTIRHLFTLKAIAAPAAGIALLALCLVKANGAGDLLSAPAKISGSTLGWEFVGQLMSCIANMATLATNAVDFASRASKPSDVVLPQIISLPFCFAITSLIGILIGSSTTALFGEYVWSPLEVMERFLTVEGGASHGMRAGVAFISIGFSASSSPLSSRALSPSPLAPSPPLLPLLELVLTLFLPQSSLNSAPTSPPTRCRPAPT